MYQVRGSMLINIKKVYIVQNENLGHSGTVQCVEVQREHETAPRFQKDSVVWH